MLKAVMKHQYWEFIIFFLIWSVFFALSWEKFPQYFVAWNSDLGKEVMIPLRILNGEIPFKDFGLVYPPFPYYVNAGFLYIFGKTFNNFFVLGAIQSIIYLFLAWKFLKEISIKNWYRWLMLMILITCAIFPGENDGRFCFPYTFNWSYSLIFSFSTLLFMTRYLETKEYRALWGAGIFCGLGLLSKQDFLFCALITIFLGLFLEYSQLPDKRKEGLTKISTSAGIIILAIGAPVVVFNLLLIIVGVSPSSLMNSWFPRINHSNIANQFPVWHYYSPFNFRFIIFGMILVFCIAGSYFFNQKKKKGFGLFLIFGLIALLLRQVYNDAIQFDFRIWVTMLSAIYGIIHLTQIKGNIYSKRYLLTLFPVAILGFQMRFIGLHGVINLNWDGNLNIFILFGALLFLIDIANRFKDAGLKVYHVLLSTVMIIVIFSSSLHLVRYYQEDRWKKIATRIGPLFLPNKTSEAKTFSEALAWLNQLPANEKIFSLNGEFLFSSAGRMSKVSYTQPAFLMTAGEEKEIIQMLSDEKIEYVFVVQEGDYFPLVLGYLYGLDLHQFLRNNYYTYKMWDGEITFKEFQAVKHNLNMVYILRRLR